MQSSSLVQTQICYSDFFKESTVISLKDSCTYALVMAIAGNVITEMKEIFYYNQAIRRKQSKVHQVAFECLIYILYLHVVVLGKLNNMIMIVKTGTQLVGMSNAKSFEVMEWEVTCRGFLLYTRGKSYCKTTFQSGMNLRKGQKQGRDEKTQEEDYPTYTKIHSRCSRV